MTRLHILGVSALALTLWASDALAQRRGGAVSTGVRGAVVGGMVGGSAGAETGAKIGAVTGATRAAVDREAERRANYQSSAAYQSAPASNFATAQPQVLAATPATSPTPAPVANPTGAETIIRKDGKPVIGVTFPADWKLSTGDHHVSAVSADGEAYSMVATMDGAADKPAAIASIKHGLERYLQDIKFDETTETKRGALVVTGTARGKKPGVDVVFAAGVLDAGAGQIAGAAFVVDARIEDHYKDAVRYICETIRVGDQLAEKR
jgi:hypothetical protein